MNARSEAERSIERVRTDREAFDRTVQELRRKLHSKEAKLEHVARECMALEAALEEERQRQANVSNVVIESK